MVLIPPDASKDQPTEPLVTRASVVAGVTAVLTCATAFGLDLTPKQTAGILGLAAVAAPLVAAFWARRKVWSPASVAKVVEANLNSAPPATTGSPTP